GKTWFRKAYPDEAYRHRVVEAWLEDLRTKSLRDQGIYNVVCKDGSTKVISFIPVQLGNGDVIMVCEDITERKRLEAQLINAQKMEAIGTLSGGIAHDFNNILMGIQGYISLMMLDAGAGHPHREWLGNIEELVRNAADLTGQLLGFARGGKYNVKPLSMNELVEKTSAMFGRTKKEIIIRHGYQTDVWPVEGDQGQIEQVLLNLYLNAWQAMPAGGVLSLGTRNTVIASAEADVHSVTPGRYVCTSITDSGVGMDVKTRERIFEPFFTTKELGRGTGLGLAMVYGIVRNHNGYIDVESEPGKGSTFRFHLPASERDVARIRPETAETVKGVGTVLLVDDEPAVLTVSKAMIESLGYTVHAVGNGEKAIALYREGKDSIDLIVLDMIMPGLSGGETFNRLREMDPGARVILSSGYSLNEQARGIMEKGCRGFVQKPFTIADISRKLREVLET
ncbi:MAG TPA: response regulator, partial [Syntrophorhabdaceae bacterium]|nr:response regulator [Syntrophorhabdaceae bacterium]